MQRYEVQRIGDSDSWFIWDSEMNRAIAATAHKGDAQHIVGDMNAVHAMIASVWPEGRPS